MLRRCVRLVLPCVLLTAFACNDVVDEEVPADVCISGKRWVGGDRGSPNMYPGRDCVGCHKDNGAPELILGGTFYAALDSDETAQSENCFGLEGVKIRVEGGDGQVYETTTNEAGNFWFAARDADITMPYSVTTSYINPVTGLEEGPPMTTAPRYGGCARCHNVNALTIAESGADFNLTPSDADYVNGQPQIGAPGSGGIDGYLQFIAEGNEPFDVRLPEE